MVWQIHRVHGPNSSESEKVRWSTGTDCPDRIFNSFQLTGRIVNKMDSNTLACPLFIISVVIQIMLRLLISKNNF